MTKQDVQFSKLVVFINSAVPLTLLLWDWSQHQLGANPLEYVTHTTGTLTLLFLCLSLAVTPLRKALGLPWLIQWRRMLGLFAFFYGCLHLLAYTWFDKFFAFGAIVHVDHKTGARQRYELPAGDAASEPVFVPRSADAAEGDGWLLLTAYRAAEHRSDLLVLDAGDVARGPVATVQLSHRVPFGFHGNWRQAA